jgi:3-isopropylmalate/(R)-2-methylmalate dehydratase small subunit
VSARESEGSRENGGGSAAITRIEGRGLPLRGDDMDTDRIIPARFLRAVSFDGLERHLFEDDRAADPSHPLGSGRYDGAAILVVNANFGCGSSREHAPQAIARAGFRALVGESFSEIFQGNAAMLGLPCFRADAPSIARLQALVEEAPGSTLVADVEAGTVSAGGFRCTAAIPGALRDAFLNGRWDPTAMLLDRFDDVTAIAARLPYIGWQRPV